MIIDATPTPDYVQGCNLIFLTCSVLVSALIGVCQMELIFCLTLKIYTILEYLPQTCYYLCLSKSMKFSLLGTFSKHKLLVLLLLRVECYYFKNINANKGVSKQWFMPGFHHLPVVQKTIQQKVVI